MINHKDGKKYKDGKVLFTRERRIDKCPKAISDRIFKMARDKVTTDETYKTMRHDWRSNE